MKSETVCCAAVASTVRSIERGDRLRSPATAGDDETSGDVQMPFRRRREPSISKPAIRARRGRTSHCRDAALASATLALRQVRPSRSTRIDTVGRGPPRQTSTPVNTDRHQSTRRLVKCVEVQRCSGLARAEPLVRLPAPPPFNSSGSLVIPRRLHLRSQRRSQHRAGRGWAGD